MACEDTAKLRTPLNAVCQTPDIGCIPITSGKPTCKPQPDEIPLAFDPSTTTLWIFSCETREWIAFQKFSMCQLSSINLDNIQNICDILQIGVNYNPGTGCRQGTISLRELAEKILECVQLQTKAVSVTANGDKLKIWVDGLDPLPPFYVKGKNIWSEGGSGTDSDPLRIATHDPICQWPIKTQEQINNATTKHIGACVDGNMVRAPYPEMPCEFPQMTVDQVNGAADKDMIVCVDGENAKVPIHDQLLTPICDNPQISVSQAKAKPKLRIVSCEDGKIMLFPLPPEMFQGYYMCVPFIDGVPSGPPAEGSGPIRFDCNDDIWFWVCEENRWHRIDVGNHYHPPWKEVYDFIANRCENIKFHGWSEQDECYTDFEMTPQELADFILCECLDPVTPVQANAAIDRGEEVKFPICVDGTAKKIDWSLCSWPYISPAQINAAIAREEEANLGICVDGKNYKTNWNVCSWPDLDYEDVASLIEAQKDLKFALCADGENHISSIRTIIDHYCGVEYHSAGSNAAGFGGFLYESVTLDGGVFIMRSRDGAIIKGSGVPNQNSLNSIPFGHAELTLTNDSDILKFYMLFEYSHIQRNWNTAGPYNCTFGLMTALSAEPALCSANAYTSEEWNNYTGGSGSDKATWDSRTCEQRRAQQDTPWIGKGQLARTSEFDISLFDDVSNKTMTHATLPKVGGINRYSLNKNPPFIQIAQGFNFSFIYLLPRESITISQECLITITDYDGGSVIISGHHRFHAIGFPGSRVLNATDD